MTLFVFGHKSPDADSAGAAMIWAWYLSEIQGVEAEARLLGQPNAEAAFMMAHWGKPQPAILQEIKDNQSVVIVDTNNPAELPDNINNADIRAIIDHHKLVGGLETRGPIDITIRPLACTATIQHQLMGEHAKAMPDGLKGVMLSCILSDTLGFRSPTTTDIDKALAEHLADELKMDIGAYTDQMFAAKSDISGFSEVELIRMDSKKYEVGGKKLRVSVLETTAPDTVFARKESLISAMEKVAEQDGVDQVLFFVVDILNEESTLFMPNALTRQIAEKSFGVHSSSDTVLLPGVVSRKKQIIPVLSL